MRPVTLELEGFGAFRDRTVVDLSDAELFAVVGATGHGKSTLIDAICFALYGKVPRHGKGEIAPVITLGANEAKVSFTFELGERRYVATRVLRRELKGAKTRALRLELVEPDGTVDVLAGSVGEFQAAVLALVGLDFDQFTKCVVLPQGRFAEFLHAPAGERTAILSALLDLGRYDRMATAARDLANTSAGRRAAMEQERHHAGAVTAADVNAARERAQALAELQAGVERARPTDTRLSDEIDAARADAARVRQVLDVLTTVRVPDDVRDLAHRAQEAAVAVDTTTRAAVDAEVTAGDLESRRDAGPVPASLQAVLDAHSDRAKVADRIAKGVAVHEARTADVARAKDSLVAAQTAAAAEEATFEAVRHRNAHADLRATLAVGEPCPVCEQPVGALPAKVATGTLTKARKALDAKRAALKKAEAAAATAHTEWTTADALLTGLRERVAEFDVRVSDHPDPDVVAAQLEDARRLHAEAGDARRRATAARADATAATAVLQGMDHALRRAAEALSTQRDTLVTLGLTPPSSSDADLGGRWDALANWALDVLPDHEKRAAELGDLVRCRVAERDALFGDLAARTAALGIEASPARALTDLATAVVAAARDAEHDVRRTEERRARVAELDDAITAEREREQVTSELGRLLDKRHFGQWLVDEALHGLVAGASEILERLSAGQYALAAAADGELLVVDHVNADETRSVRSLSGGETFQASLALALALADRVAELATDGAATLESIFLDEGFGTLDPETLDVVAGTIESLGHGMRVVGIVTHVPELAERMPTRLRVRKQGRSAVVTREDG